MSRENLTSLSLSDESFDAILCWGVLMHVPDVEAATAELARVLKPGGRLAISETNMRSLEGVTPRWLRRLMGRAAERVERTAAGVEHWTRSSAGPLVTHESDIAWLVGRFRELGLALRTRVAGQLSESYVRVDSTPAKQAIHSVNRLWFKYVRWAGPALGNILVFERRGD